MDGTATAMDTFVSYNGFVYEGEEGENGRHWEKA